MLLKTTLLETTLRGLVLFVAALCCASPAAAAPDGWTCNAGYYDAADGWVSVGTPVSGPVCLCPNFANAGVE